MVLRGAIAMMTKTPNLAVTMTVAAAPTMVMMMMAEAIMLKRSPGTNSEPEPRFRKTNKCYKSLRGVV